MIFSNLQILHIHSFSKSKINIIQGQKCAFFQDASGIWAKQTELGFHFVPEFRLNALALLWFYFLAAFYILILYLVSYEP